MHAGYCVNPLCSVFRSAHALFQCSTHVRMSFRKFYSEFVDSQNVERFAWPFQCATFGTETCGVSGPQRPYRKKNLQSVLPLRVKTSVISVYCSVPAPQFHLLAPLVVFNSRSPLRSAHRRFRVAPLWFRSAHSPSTECFRLD